MPFNVHGAPCAPSFPPRNAEVLGMAPDRRRITRLIAKLFKADPGAQARFSALTGENETTIAHWFSDDSRRQYRMPVDLLADAVEALGKVEIYAAIVAENGLNPPTPRARPTSNPAPLLDAMSRLFAHVGEVGSEVCAAGADVDPDEAERIYAKGAQARAALDEMLARLPVRGAS